MARKHIVFFRLIILFLIICLCSLLVLRISNNRYNQVQGDTLFRQVYDSLDGFPDSADGFGYTKVYYYDGTREYMLLQNGKKRISGIRHRNQNATFYLDGTTWSLGEDGLESHLLPETDPVPPILKGILSSLLNDSSLFYTYQVAKGIPLPLWVYPNDPYIQCRRDSFPGSMEVMVYNTADYGNYISWNIIDSEGKVVLFLFTCPYMEGPNSTETDILFGWGMIEEEVYSSVFDSSS